MAMESHALLRSLSSFYIFLTSLPLAAGFQDTTKVISLLIIKSKQSKHKINMIQSWKIELKRKPENQTENRGLSGHSRMVCHLPLFSASKCTCSWFRKLVETIKNNCRIKSCEELNGNMHLNLNQTRDIESAEILDRVAFLEQN